MPAEALARLMDFVSATHAALRSGVYAGELRRRFEAAVVEEAILPSDDSGEDVAVPIRGGNDGCESPDFVQAARRERELRKALAIAEETAWAIAIKAGHLGVNLAAALDIAGIYAAKHVPADPTQDCPCRTCAAYIKLRQDVDAAVQS